VRIDAYQNEVFCTLIPTKAKLKPTLANEGINMRNPIDVDEEDDPNYENSQ